MSHLKNSINKSITKRESLEADHFPENTKKIKLQEITYKKRPGTAASSGHFYESKKLALILFRLLNNKTITHFYLGSNIDEIGALDDIIFKYKFKDQTRSKITFIQAKHRENIDKHITLQDLSKKDSDFSLFKYFESYLRIRFKFIPNSADHIFADKFDNVDCEFVIYTPANQSFNQNYTDTSKQDILYTSETGTIVQFGSHETHSKIFNELVKGVPELCIQILADYLGDYINSNTNDDIDILDSNELIANFKEILTEKVFDIEQTSCSKNNMNSKEPYHIAKFYTSFFDNNEDQIRQLRDALYKKVKIMDNAYVKQPENCQNLLNELLRDPSAHTISELLPANILRFNYQKSTLQFDNKQLPEEIKHLQTDIEKLKITKKVWQDAIKNIKTKQLKNFNLKLPSSSHNQDFSVLSLDTNCGKENLVNDFLSKLKFYTNQAKEHGVEHILKTEMLETSSKQQQKSEVFDIRIDALFLKFHNEVQKWWEKDIEAPYLTESCDYYKIARKEILKSPMLTILNFMFVNTIDNIQFSQESVKLIGNILESSSENILNLVSDNIELSSLKLAHYFKFKKFNSHTFINLDHALQNQCYEDAISEFIADTNLNILIIICQVPFTSDKICSLYESCTNILDRKPNKKIMLLTKDNNSLTEKFALGFKGGYVEKRVSNNLTHLSSESQTKILNQANVIFQGEKANLAEIIDEQIKHLINAEILSQIIDNQKIEVGSKLSNFSHLNSNYYVSHTPITFHQLSKTIEVYLNDIFVLRGTTSTEALSLFSCKTNEQKQKPRLFILSENDEEQNVDDFKQICYEYPQTVIHLIESDGNQFIWNRYYDSYYIKRKYDVIEGGKKLCFDEADLISAIKRDRFVVISDLPGTGKSTTLLYILLECHKKYNHEWIIIINLRKCKNKINNLPKFDQFDADVVVNFLCSISNTNSNLDKIILKHRLMEQGDLLLLLDGFDEIQLSHQENIISLLKFLKKDTKVKLVITTRPHEKEQSDLENTLSVVACQFQPISFSERQEFLIHLWKNAFKFKYSSNEVQSFQYSVFSRILLHEIDNVIQGNVSEFMGIPLQTRMLAEAYLTDENGFENNRNESEENKIRDLLYGFNIIQLFEKIFKRKYDIYFNEKTKFGSLINNDDKARLISSYNKEHQYCAFQYYFASHEYSKDIEIFFSYHLRELRDENSRIKLNQIGIVQCQGIEIHFIHRTFAEYLISELILDRLAEMLNCSFWSDEIKTNIWKFLLNHIFTKESCKVIRSFINCRLSEKSFDLSRNVFLQQETVFQLLIKQPSRNGGCVLHRALKESALQIFEIFVKNLENNLSKQNLDAFIEFLSNGKVLRKGLKLGDQCYQQLNNLLNCIKQVDSDRVIDVLTNFNAISGLCFASTHNFNKIIDIIFSYIKESDYIRIFNDTSQGMTMLSNLILTNTLREDHVLLQYFSKLSGAYRRKILYERNEKIICHYGDSKQPIKCDYSPMCLAAKMATTEFYFNDPQYINLKKLDHEDSSIERERQRVLYAEAPKFIKNNYNNRMEDYVSKRNDMENEESKTYFFSHICPYCFPKDYSCWIQLIELD